MKSNTKKLLNLIILGMILAILTVNNLNFSFYQDNSNGKLEFRDETNLKTANSDINIITPENITYTGPMSGYYPATYGFENDEVGTFPEGWVDLSGSGCSVAVIDELVDHKKVIDFNDPHDSYQAYISQDFTLIKTNGSFEFWIRITDATDYFVIYTTNSTGGYAISFMIRDDKWQYNGPGAGWIVVPGVSDPQDNTWHHVLVDFECSSGGYMGLPQYRYRLTIDGTPSGLLQFDGSISNDMKSIHLRSSLSKLNYHIYIDAIGYSWDSNYNIGDNLFEGLLLSFENSTALNWMGYSLDGSTNRTIMGNTTLPLPSDGSHMVQVFGNDTSGTIYESYLRRFSVHHINIHTPEDKIYTEPMNGYYPATYGFENDENESFPKGWVDNSDPNGYSKVIGEIGGHKKILECYSGLQSESRISTSVFFDPQEYGSFEFWWYKSSSYSSAAIVDFWGETPGACISIRVDHWLSANKVEYQNASGYQDTGYTDYADNKWMHFRIDFNCSSDTYSLWIDQVEYLDNIDFLNSKDETGFIQMRFDSYDEDNAVLYYVDAVYFSWDSNYNIGDNLFEGLLLSFENSTTLNWMGYSLDGNTNRTIMGNTTIPFPSDGSHIIQVFGNDTIGTSYKSKIRYFSVDTLSPVLTIITPIPSDFFGTIPPNFTISITELFLQSTWYTLDDGITNIIFSGLTGTINQTEWDKKGNGTVTVRFYANDTVGHEGYDEVNVRKDIIAPSSSISYFVHKEPNIVNKSTTFTLTANDGNGSGISVIRYKINNSDWFDYSSPFNLAQYTYGDILISYQAIDEVGNVETVNTELVKLVQPPSEEGPLNIILITILSTAAVIGVVVIIIVLVRKKK